MRYSAGIMSGRGEGKRMGFPTLNFRVPPGFAEQRGIYAGWVWIKNERFATAFHWGPLPAFNLTAEVLEAHLLDMSLDSAPESASFEFVKYLRPVKNFASKEDLARQIAEDVKETRRVLSSSNS